MLRRHALVRRCLAGGWLVYGCWLYGQEVPRLQLRVKSETPVPGVALRMIMDPIRCDQQGSLYLRPSEPPRSSRSPVLKISPEGKQTAVFSREAVPGYENAEIVDFALGPRGEFYALTLKPVGTSGEVHILSFNDEGRFNFDIKLERLFYVDRMAAFADGNFLVAGSKAIEPPKPQRKPEPGEEPEPESVEPYTAIFNRAGRVLFEMKFESDSKLADDGTKLFPPEVISLGRAVSGEDGNIYLLRVGAKPLVHVISPTGELLRSMVVTPPTDKARVMDMMSGGRGRLILKFSTELEAGRRYDALNSVISLVDAETGERLYDYQSAPDIGWALACYAPNEFLYLGTTQSGGLTLRRVAPR